MQSVKDVKEADDSCTLNRLPSVKLRPGQLATLSADVIAAEMRRSKSGPALALGTYLRKPSGQRLEWLTKAVLTALDGDTVGWEAHAAAVKEASENPANHPLECGCDMCL